MKRETSGRILTVLASVIIAVITGFYSSSRTVSKLSFDYGALTNQVKTHEQRIMDLTTTYEDSRLLTNEVSNIKISVDKLEKSDKEQYQLINNIAIVAREASQEAKRATQSNIDFTNKLEVIRSEINTINLNLAVVKNGVAQLQIDFKELKVVR